MGFPKLTQYYPKKCDCGLYNRFIQSAYCYVCADCGTHYTPEDKDIRGVI